MTYLTRELTMRSRLANAAIKGENMRRMIAVGVATVMIGTPAVAGNRMYAVTPSGTAETVFRDLGPVEASGKLASTCINNGLTVISSSANEVVCQIKMGAFKSALAQALIGNSYSTPPRNLIRFTLSPVGRHTRVQASRWLETQMAFGQTRTEALSSDETHNDVINFMLGAGATYPPGTSFPNHGYLGLNWDPARVVKFGGKNTPALPVKEVVMDAPASRAGLHVGDELVAIQGKTFKDVEDIEKRLRVPAGQPLALTVLRSGQPLVLQAVSGRREPVPLEDLTAGGPTQPLASLPAAPMSVADELAKLADLKSKGIITEAEFQAQKVKLLAK